MTAVNYLQRHPTSGIYSFRRAVPPELRTALGKREIVRTLRTKDPVEAKRLAMIKAIEVEKQFAEALQARQPDKPASATILSLAEAEAWAQQWKQAELAQDAEERARRPTLSADRVKREAEAMAQHEADFRHLLARNDPTLIMRRVGCIAAEHGLDLEKAPEATRVLGSALLRAFAELYGELRDRAEGRWAIPEAPQPSPSPSPACTVADEPSLRLSEAFTRFNAERKLRPQSHLEFSSALRRFGEIAGSDLAVGEISKAHVRAYTPTARVIHDQRKSVRSANFPASAPRKGAPEPTSSAQGATSARFC